MDALKATDEAAYEALFERAHATPNGRGVFWRVLSGNAPKSYIFGTFSDTGLGRTPLKDTVDGALSSARVLMIPMTEAEQQRLDKRMASDPAFAINVKRQGLMAKLPDDERAQVAAAMQARGVPPKIIDKLRPPILYSLLNVPPCVSAQAQDGGQTQEDRIVAEATEAGIPVEGLETYEAALGSVAAVPSIDTILLAGLRDVPIAEDNHRTALDLYKEAETAAIWEFKTLSAQRAVGEAAGRQSMDEAKAVMLGSRNKAWAEKAAPELRKGGVFMAVDALHLPGEKGLIEYLRAMDFLVVRLDG